MTRKPNIVLFNPDQWRGDIMGHLGDPAAKTPFLDGLIADDAVSFSQTYCQAVLCTPSRCSFMTGLYPHVFGHRSLHHMLHTERGQRNMLDELRDGGYKVWWGGKNDLFPAEEGPEAHSDIYFRPDPAFFKRHTATPRPSLHKGEMDWRGEPGSDTYYSFMAGIADAGSEEDVYLDDDWQMVLGAIEFIKSYDGDQPFCLFLPILYPHPPYGVERSFYDLIDPDALPPRRHASDAQLDRKSKMLREIRRGQGLADWSEERWTELRRVYYAMIARVDQQFRMVMDALKEAGLYDDTAAIMFSDHGDLTGDYEVVEKCQTSFEDSLVRVPMVIKPDSSWQMAPGIRSDTMVELVDLCATVYDIAGITPGYDHFGRSLRSAIADAKQAHRDFVCCEGGRREDEMQVSEIDALRQFGDPEVGSYYPKLRVQVEDAEAHARAIMIRTLDHKMILRITGEDEFYDLAADPQECENRFDDPLTEAVRGRLTDRLARWYLDTSDIVPQQTDKRWRSS